MFDVLFAFYGPQHWWPGDTPFEIIIGAILTQNTNWRNVESALKNLKRRERLSAAGIHATSTARLAALIRPAGYYHVKAARVKEFVRFFLDTYNGEIKRMKRRRADSLRKEFLAIKGIGEETCDSILLYALGKPVFVIDAYTRRIFSRHGFIEEDATYSEIQDLFESNLRGDAKLYNEYHALLVRLGKERCRRRNPICEGCPLQKKMWGQIPLERKIF
jgi:endonuclease-3 related protein